METHINNLLKLKSVDEFTQYLNDNHLTLGYETIDAIGYEGKRETVLWNDAKLFVCCKCQAFCVSPYYGICDKCDIGTCYDCAIGNNVRTENCYYEYNVV